MESKKINYKKKTKALMRLKSRITGFKEFQEMNKHYTKYDEEIHYEFWRDVVCLYHIGDLFRDMDICLSCYLSDCDCNNCQWAYLHTVCREQGNINNIYSKAREQIGSKFIYNPDIENFIHTIVKLRKTKKRDLKQTNK
jgi:proteasome lid subunit RPN8/RPN11